MVIVLSLIFSCLLYFSFCENVDAVFSEENLRRECLGNKWSLVDPIGVVVYLSRYYVYARILLKYFLLIFLAAFNLVLVEAVRKWEYRKLLAVVLSLSSVLVVYFNLYKPFSSILAGISLLCLTIVVLEGKVTRSNAILVALSIVALAVSATALILPI